MVPVLQSRHSAVLSTFTRELSEGGADVSHQRRLITGKYTLRPLISQLEDTGGTEYCVSGEARTPDLPIINWMVSSRVK